MKKFALAILILIATASLAFAQSLGFEPLEVNAANNSITTGIFLPTSYLQYYKLENPYAVYCCDEVDGQFVAISHKDHVVIYKNETFASIDISPLTSGIERGVTAISRYKNFLLFLFSSKIYSIDLTGFGESGWTASPVDTGIISITSFSICGDKLLTHTNDFIFLNEIDPNETSQFSLKTAEYAFVAEKNTATVMLSKTGKIYYSKSGTGGLYEYNPEADKSDLLCSVSNIRSIAENPYGEDKNLYFSCENGVFFINPERPDEQRSIFKIDPANTTEDLGNLIEPYGVCITKNGLWVVDSKINAIQEIDLSTNQFTQFAITTNSNAVNRLTDKAKDVTIDKNTIYALDSNRVVRINDVKGENTYNQIILPDSAPTAFSAGGGYICYSTADSLKVVKIEENGEPTLGYSVVYTSPEIGNKMENIVDIAYSESAFYVLRNVLTAGTKTRTAIYKIDLTEDIIPKEIAETAPVYGTGLQLTVDIFGTIYTAVLNDNSTYEFYRYLGKAENGVDVIEKIFVLAATKTINNVQTDFDGKIYLLYDDDTVDCYDGDQKVYAKTIALSPNLGGVDRAKSFCLSYDSKTAYFIFSGLILKSTENEEMDISTPHDIPIPQNFEIAYDSDAKFGKLKDGAKMFDIDVTKLSGECFEFFGYRSSSDSLAGREYAVLGLDERYSLVICDGISSVVRTSDLTAIFKAQPIDQKGYAAVSFSVYSLPVLTEEYKLNTIEKFSYMSINGQITFNGKEYMAVSFSDVKGFIPKTFAIDKIIAEKPNGEVSSVYVYSPDGVVVSDDGGLEIDILKGKNKVAVIGERETTLLVRYANGKVGFIAKEYVVSDSQRNLLKAIAIMLATISLAVTCVYLEYRFLIENQD